MRDEMVSELRVILRDLFGARYQGNSYARLARANGYADGYMDAMLRKGVVTRAELLAIVGEERARVAGPATGEVAVEPSVA